MSSDVQEVTRQTGEPPCGLEDLKEATDETELADARIIVMEDQCDPDILYIPLNFAFGINPRNSYPPTKGILPFQHIMRSFSDSHLCLKITTAPSPCYSLTSPISSSPSILLLDISERIINPLRRTKGTSFLPVEYLDEESADERFDYTNLDTEYVQQWLKIDETRNILQQQQRDLLELEYDRAELEDWSLNLSSEDVWKRSNEIPTPGQLSLSTLPSIQENNALELEEDSNEDLWNNSSYMMDKTGGELVALLMDAPINNRLEKRWPYNNHNLNSPGDSWSSAETNSEEFHEHEPYSKRSSAALSDDANESHAIGTDFTRDFYRLVKFESTKSLASVSSKSICLSECDREQALQNVLTFIAEQQIYCNNCEEIDSRPNSAFEEQRDFNIEAPPQNIEEIHDGEFNSVSVGEKDDNYVNLKQLCSELVRNEQNKDCISQDETILNSDPNVIVQSNTSNKGKCSADVSSVKMPSDSVTSDKKLENICNITESLSQSSCSAMSESQASSVSTPETIISRIPRRTATPLKASPKKESPKHTTKTKIPSNVHRSPKQKQITQKSTVINSRASKSDTVLCDLTSKPAQNCENINGHLQRTVNFSKDQRSPKQKQIKPKTVTVNDITSKKSTSSKEVVSKPVINSESLPQCHSGLLSSNIIDGPPHRAVSFHERATSKDVIEELNRIIRKGDENGSQEEILEKNRKLDEACRPTGWVHVEKGVDLNDAKVKICFSIVPE